MIIIGKYPDKEKEEATVNRPSTNPFEFTT
jgi:hypothetical protein